MKSLLHLSWTAVVPAVFAFGLCAGCAPIGDVDPPTQSKKAPPIEPKPVPIHLPGVLQANAPDTTLKTRIEDALEQVKNRDLMTTHSFWTVFHAILGNGLDCQIRVPSAKNTQNAVKYIRDGGQLRGLRFFTDPFGVDVQIGPQFDGQGHADQFVAEMAQLGLPMDAAFKIDGVVYPFAEFVRHSEMNVKKPFKKGPGGTEFTWTMVAMAQLHGTDYEWTNKDKEKLRFEDLVRHELDESIEAAACGGTHRLFGLTWCLFLRQKEGRPMTGVWQEIPAKLRKYQAIARKDQNSDGSFSTEYFKGPGDAKDLDRRINTTGHILEWLSLWLPQDELRSGWMQEAANALTLLIFEGQGRVLDGGSLYHAAHGLHLYHSRVWGEPSDPRRAVLPLPKR
jgi:hypothetical protein